ncbi:STAS domain-containing protein [Amycolatopsis sp. NPDC051372]|uniref:STAS domain-containing protein n=1 Tax=Amycolatopsis sp. NPDC051372 TaxID=3155669 RepID=UPI00342A859D
MTFSNRSETSSGLPLGADFDTGDEFHLCVRRPTPTVAVVEVAGEVDSCTAPQLEEVVGSLLRSTVEIVVIDLSPSMFLSVAGLRVLSQLDLVAGEHGVDFSVDPGSSHAALRLLQLVPIGCERRGRARAFDNGGPRSRPARSATRECVEAEFVRRRQE